jgi:hypothetical protein
MPAKIAAKNTPEILAHTHSSSSKADHKSRIIALKPSFLSDVFIAVVVAGPNNINLKSTATIFDWLTSKR